MKTSNRKIVNVGDWDKFVQDTYGRIYTFQQQDGCKQQETFFNFTIPCEDTYDYGNDTVPEVVNHREMGVSFQAWLERDPKQKLATRKDADSWVLDLWWERNFYPEFYTIANDLYSKGLIEAGDYSIHIDW